MENPDLPPGTPVRDPVPPAGPTVPYVPFDNTSVRAVLEGCGGFAHAAIEAFMTVHADSPMTMPFFLRSLRTVDNPGTEFDTDLGLDRLALMPRADWHARLDRETIVLLAHWLQEHDHRNLRTFDWSRSFHDHDFETFAYVHLDPSHTLYGTPGHGTPRTSTTVPVPTGTVQPQALFGPRSDTASTDSAGALRKLPAVSRPTGSVPPAAPGTVVFHSGLVNPAPSDTVPTVLVPPPASTSVPPSSAHPPAIRVDDPGAHLAGTHLAGASAYVHDYHDEIVAADAADYARRSNNDAVTSPRLGPRMWRHINLTANISDLDRKSFLSTHLMPLTGTDAPLIHAWYTQLVLQATIANIDLCPLREFDSKQALWPSNKPANIVFEMSSLLLAKITPLIDIRHSADLRVRSYSQRQQTCWLSCAPCSLDSGGHGFPTDHPHAAPVPRLS